MNNQIAVLVNTNNQTCSFNEKGLIKIYEKADGNWITRKQIPINITETLNLMLVRENLFKTIEELGDCRLLVAKEVSGLPYNLLDKNGFEIWELEGTSEEFLEYVLEENHKELLSKEKATNESKKANLVEKKKDGYYYINLKKLQQNNTGITSKQALLSFFKEQTFYELEVICSHIPPWFENEFEKLNLMADTKKLNVNEYRVIVCHKVC